MEPTPSELEPAATGHLSPQEPQPKPPQHKRWLRWVWIGTIIGVVLVVLGIWYWYSTQHKAQNNTKSSPTAKKTTLVIAVHWLEKSQLDGVTKDGKLVSKGLNQYLDEYKSLHKDVDFVVQQIPFGEYADKLKVLNDSGAAPDIFQAYSPWAATYVHDGMLATPPADVVSDVKANYVSTAGATIEGKIWGFPTEINNYSLLYNKDLFAAAGIKTAPKTWAELVTDAGKLTKKDSKGTITQYGMAFLKDNDWEVVDPFLSLLFTNQGNYLSSDLKKAEFNSQAGVEALDAEMALFKNGSTDINGNFFDFKDGKVGMVISPPWTKSTFAASYGDKFSSTVGVAPMPYLKAPNTLQYSWLTGVMKASQHQKEAWEFLKWFNTDVQAGTGTTRYGDLLANTIGAIPSRKVDFQKHQDVLGDSFTSVYVNQMQNSQAEPNVLQSGQIKQTLMREIQAVWSGQKTTKQGLDDAATAINKILQQYY